MTGAALIACSLIGAACGCVIGSMLVDAISIRRVRRTVQQEISEALEDWAVYQAGPPLSEERAYRLTVRASIATALRLGSERRGR